MGTTTHGARRPLSSEVAGHIRERILSGAWQPGEFVRMEPLSAAVGVSTTPVREALLTLVAEGSVELVPRRGYIVVPFTRQDVYDLFWAQATLLGELAARAATRVTPAQVAFLRSLAEQYDQAANAGDKDLVADLGHAFHRSINQAAESPRLALLLASVARRVPNRFYASLDAQVEVNREQHPELVDVLGVRDPDVARRLMHDHITQTADHVVGFLERRGLWDGQAVAGPREGQ